MDKKQTEEGLSFAPKYDEKGLVPCVATCAKTGDVVMFAYMNAESLRLTLETGEAHYWSRSRNELWHKGATSGHIQKVLEIRTDCDQDCIWIKVEITEGACHTGRKGCFYRKVVSKDKLEFIDADRVFNPKDIYGSII